jgi:hypothetical protein
MTGSSGVSSTPRLLDSINDISGILDHPPEPVIGRRVAPTRWRVMTDGVNVKQPQSRDLAARCARVLRYSFAPKQRAQGMPGARCARSRVWCVESTRVSHHGHTGNTRHSPRNGFNGYFALSRVTGLVCHPRLAELPPRNLTPASGRQDHTTSPSTSSALRRCVPSASTASRLTSGRRSRNAPPERRDAGDVLLIWVSGEAEYFCWRDWTRQISLICFKKFVFARKR